MKKNIIQNKSFKFAINIIEFYKILINQKEYILSKQILRSGTSIEANIEEAIGAQSKKDFISKLSIAYKEARETNYWLLLLDSQNVFKKNEKLKLYLFQEIKEINQILSTIILNTKQNMNKSS